MMRSPVIETALRTMNRGISLTVLPLLGAVAVFAQGVDPAAITTFEAGTPARAADINGNFQALINAINDNAARIANLETGSAACTTRDFVVGSTYRMLAAPIGLGGENALGRPWVETAAVEEEYTFLEDGTCRSHGNSVGFALGRAEDGIHAEVKERRDDYTDPGTWEVEGNELRVTWQEPGDGWTGTISAGGNTIFVLVSEPAGDDADKPEFRPGDTRITGLAVLVKVNRKPVIGEILRDRDGSTESHHALRIVLEDKGSGPPLEYGWSQPSSDRSRVAWQRGDTLMVSKLFVQIAGSWGFFWARRGCNEDFLSEPSNLVR